MPSVSTMVTAPSPVLWFTRRAASASVRSGDAFLPEFASAPAEGFTQISSRAGGCADKRPAAAAAWNAAFASCRLFIISFDDGGKPSVNAGRYAGTAMLEEEASKALDGDRDALDNIVRALQGDIFGLALRMLSNREDAEDATQEILVRIVTRLSQFDFRSKLKTWAYRVAVNYILDVKKSPVERLQLSFERFAEDLTSGLDLEAPAETERLVLIEEVKIGCTFGMLQCLDRPHRLAYVLGEIMEVPGPEAAIILETSADLFRKRLQHARSAIVSFTRSYCGLASDTAPCRCNKQLPAALRAGKVHAGECSYAGKASSFDEARAMVRRVDEARWALEVHRNNQPRASSVDLARRLVETLDQHHKH
jgi:RNA polymerase sigma factor (sigma-70 family)